MNFADNFWKTIILSFASIIMVYSESNWSYENPEDWGKEFEQCDGNRQSPIHLRLDKSLIVGMAPIRFINYDTALNSSMKLVNNGHTANLVLTPVLKNKTPQIKGAKLPGVYEAVSLHFHWGSRDNEGSEHVINRERFDVEMHIVHKNTKYATVDTAVKYKDGLAVLGVMITKTVKPKSFYSGLSAIFKKIPDITTYNSETTLDREIKLNGLLGVIDRDHFYTYQGSLTTPPCSEAVTWIVFSDTLPVKTTLINNLYNLKDKDGNPLLNNFRPLQDVGNRKIFYRKGNVKT